MFVIAQNIGAFFGALTTFIVYYGKFKSFFKISSQLFGISEKGVRVSTHLAFLVQKILIFAAKNMHLLPIFTCKFLIILFFTDNDFTHRIPIFKGKI